MMRLRAFVSAALLALSSTTLVFNDNAAMAASAKEQPEIIAKVISIDGKGSAQLRRKSGTVALLANSHELSAGDKITTDDKTVVQLGLPDGSIVRIGINTEYRIESVRLQDSFLGWVFELTRGSVRALVEKSAPRKESKFRINTPAGTMGVRGTEFLISHDPLSNVTTLITIEGKVGFGARDCEKKENCLMVETGQMSSIRGGDNKAGEAKAFELQSLVMQTASELKAAAGGGADGTKLGTGGGGVAGPEAAALAAKLSVLASLGELGSSPTMMDDRALQKAAAEAGQELARLQDTLLNRDAETRKAMEGAAADGTLDQRMELGRVLEGSEERYAAGEKSVERFKAAEKYIEKEKGAKDDSSAKKSNRAAAAAGGEKKGALKKARDSGDQSAADSMSSERADALLKEILRKQALGSSSGSSVFALRGQASGPDALETLEQARASMDRRDALRREAAERVAGAKRDGGQPGSDDPGGHRDDPNSNAKDDPKADPKGDPKADPKADPVADPVADPKPDRKPDPKPKERHCRETNPVCDGAPGCSSFFLRCRYKKAYYQAACVTCNAQEAAFYGNLVSRTSEHAVYIGREERFSEVSSNAGGTAMPATSNARTTQPPRTCTKVTRQCTSELVPCNLEKGKRCGSPKYTQKCKDITQTGPCN